MRIINRITHRNETSINKYFTEIKRYKILTQDEEKELLTKYKRDNDLSSMYKVLNSNLRFVVSCAKNYQDNSSGMSIEDLIGFGNIGLCKAIEKFNPEKGFRFITYAVWHIKQQIILEIQKNQTILQTPINYAQIMMKINKELDKFSNENHRTPEIFELVELGLIKNYEASVYNECSSFKTIVKLQDSIDSNNHYTYEDCIRKDDDVYDVDKFFDRQHDEFLIAKILNSRRVTEIERQMVSKYFGIGCKKCTADEICVQYTLTKQNFKLILKKILKKMSSIK